MLAGSKKGKHLYHFFNGANIGLRCSNTNAGLPDVCRGLIDGPAQCFAPALLCKGILLAQPPKCAIQSLSGVCLCTSAAFHYLSKGSLLAQARKCTIQSLSEVCLCLCTSSAFRDLSKLSKRIPMAQLPPPACLQPHHCFH